jgi:hypothetical protein
MIKLDPAMRQTMEAVIEELRELASHAAMRSSD